MPALEINSHGIPAVEAFSAYLQQLLERAETVKPTRALEPALTKADFDDIYVQVGRIFADFHETNGKKFRQFAIVETAARDVFGRLVATTSINSPDFVRVWNLFDVLAILSDAMECDPPLLFWLIEELLDSQTIPGCRKVFDYLESRRERITAKYFNSTKLVILRSCNDLLRRLSRAEDTPFCGRVFIFLFQVFPLGDKSSVNLRGEYHVENVTTYDAIPAKKEGDGEAATTGGEAAGGGGGDKMDVDAAADGGAKKAPSATAATAATADKTAGVDFDALYPVFWSLQASFSQPKRLFDAAHFAQFKAGMEASLAAFRQISENNDHARSLRPMDDAARRGVKRKRGDKEGSGGGSNGSGSGGDADLADTYNPKYLTSRDLFELETSDLTFRRHFLLQALIVMEFLLSLSPQAKEKLAAANAQNKSVIYADQVLGDDDTKWASAMKHDITEHIKTSNTDGPYFLRMVDTILARDKNWVRWKAESCPSIERAPVSADEFVAAKEGAQRAFARHRRRSNPAIGSFSLDFLEDDGGDGEDKTPEEALEELNLPNRYAPPALASFENEIAKEDFEIEMPDGEASKNQAEERKASKTWRALRIVRQTNLPLFDKIDDDNNIRVVFAKDGQPDGEASGTNGTGEGDDEAVNRDSLPEDARPVVLAAPAAEITAALSKLLAERNPGVFGSVVQHTTKPRPEQAPDDGRKPFHYVSGRDFDVLLDGDKFAGFGESAGHMYGTHRGHVDAVAATGKVPLLLMNYESVQGAWDNAFEARYVFVEPSSLSALETLLAANGAQPDAVEIQAAVASATAVLEKARSEGGLFDKMVPLDGEDLEGAVKGLEAYIYGTGGEGDTQKTAKENESGAAAEIANKAVADDGGDATMVDAGAAAATDGNGGAK